MHKRLEALEAQRGGDDYATWTDEQIAQRMIELGEEIEAAGGPIDPDWRGMLHRGEFTRLIEWGPA